MFTAELLPFLLQLSIRMSVDIKKKLLLPPQGI